MVWVLLFFWGLFSQSLREEQCRIIATPSESDLGARLNQTQENRSYNWTTLDIIFPGLRQLLIENWSPGRVVNKKKTTTMVSNISLTVNDLSPTHLSGWWSQITWRQVVGSCDLWLRSRFCQQAVTCCSFRRPALHSVTLSSKLHSCVLTWGFRRKPSWNQYISFTGCWCQADTGMKIYNMIYMRCLSLVNNAGIARYTDRN